MNTGLLIIAHENVGRALIDTASYILGMCPMSLEVVSICEGCEPDDMVESAKSALRRLDSGDGVLVLTDMFGSTPSNVANRLAGDAKIKVVAGLNLPMLVRVLNYPHLSLDELVYKAISGARDGIFVCEPEACAE
mgnify:CR=1 FL=1